MGCYEYETVGTTERFHKVSAKATLAATCGTDYWDGNLLNWISFRRFDAAKLAMIGGDCVVARAADGTCPPIDGRITVNAQAKFQSSSAGFEQDSLSLALYGGRIPDNVARGKDAANPLEPTIYFHMRGGLPSANNPYPGNICVDNDSSGPVSSAAEKL